MKRAALIALCLILAIFAGTSLAAIAPDPPDTTEETVFGP